MANIYGRQVVVPLTNKSGGGVIAGDVVIVDTTNDAAFTTTTTTRAEVTVGVAQETIASNATGRVLISGYAALVNVPASVTRGHYVETYSVVKQATGNSTRRSGSFGQFLTGGTTPTAALWGNTDQTAVAGAGALTFLEAHSASSSSSLDFSSFISSTYDTYKIEATSIILQTSTANLTVQMGTGAGPTWDTGAAYEWAASGYTSGGATWADSGATSGVRLFQSMSVTAAYGFGVASLTLYDPQSTTLRRSIVGTVQYVNSTGPTSRFGTWGMQYTQTGTALSGLRFIPSSGNIVSGTIRIYGVAKS